MNHNFLHSSNPWWEAVYRPACHWWP